MDTFDTTKSMGNCYLLHPKNEIIYEYDDKGNIISIDTDVNSQDINMMNWID